MANNQKSDIAVILVEESNKKADQPEIKHIDPVKEGLAKISYTLHPLRRDWSGPLAPKAFD